MRRGSNIIDEITHSLQQHVRRPKFCWVRCVFTSCRSGIFFDCAQGVTPGQSIPFRARHHLKTMKSLLPLAFTQLSNRTHAEAGARGNSLQLLVLILLRFRSRFVLTPPLLEIPLLSSRWGILPLRVKAAWPKQEGYSFLFLSCY